MNDELTSHRLHGFQTFAFIFGQQVHRYAFTKLNGYKRLHMSNKKQFPYIFFDHRMLLSKNCCANMQMKLSTHEWNCDSFKHRFYIY